MEMLEIFDAVEKEYGKELAILSICALTINLTEKTRKKDFTKTGNFTKRINTKTFSVSWLHSNENVAKAIQIRDALHIFQMNNSMTGLGGCIKKSIKEIVEEN